MRILKSLGAKDSFSPRSAVMNSEALHLRDSESRADPERKEIGEVKGTLAISRIC